MLRSRGWFVQSDRAEQRAILSIRGAFQEMHLPEKRRGCLSLLEERYVDRDVLNSSVCTRFVSWEPNPLRTFDIRHHSAQQFSSAGFELDAARFFKDTGRRTQQLPILASWQLGRSSSPALPIATSAHLDHTMQHHSHLYSRLTPVQMYGCHNVVVQIRTMND